MAKAIQTVRWPEPDPAAEASSQRTRLQDVVTEEAQALEKLVRLAGYLDDAGLVDIANALLAQRRQVMEILVRQAEKPGTLGLVKSVMALTQGLSQTDPQALRHLFAGLSAAGAAVGGAMGGAVGAAARSGAEDAAGDTDGDAGEDAGEDANGDPAAKASRGRRPLGVGGIFGLWRAMRDPDVAAGLGVMMEMLRGIGASVRKAHAEADGTGAR